MKKKFIIVIQFLTLILSLFTETVRAGEWTNPGAVIGIQYHRGSSVDKGDAFIWLEEGVSCSRTNSYFRIRKGDTPTEDMDVMVRLLTASKLSRERVVLGFNRSSGGGTCYIFAVRYGNRR